MTHGPKHGYGSVVAKQLASPQQCANISDTSVAGRGAEAGHNGHATCEYYWTLNVASCWSPVASPGG